MGGGGAAAATTSTVPPLCVWPFLLLIPGLLHLVALQAECGAGGAWAGKCVCVCVCVCVYARARARVLWGVIHSHLGQEALGSIRGGYIRLFRTQGNVSSVGGGAESQELSAFL